MEFEGPRPACNALDTLMDQIGDPIVGIIDELPLSKKRKIAAKTKVEDVLVGVFAPVDSTVGSLRTYIHELNRRVKELEEELHVANEEVQEHRTKCLPQAPRRATELKKEV